MDQSIEKYFVKKHVAVWEFKFSKNYTGYNFSVSKGAKTQLLELINLMKQSQWPSKKVIKLRPVNEENQQWIDRVCEYHCYEAMTIVYNKNLVNCFKTTHI